MVVFQVLATLGVISAVVALARASKRQRALERRAFAEKHGLRLQGEAMMSGKLGAFSVEIAFELRSNGKKPETMVTVEAPMPRDFTLEPETIWASRDWQIGDSTFDNFVNIGGQRTYLAFALGEKQRATILRWADSKVRYRIAGQRIALTMPGHNLTELSSQLGVVRALAEHFCTPEDARAQELAARATTDPLVILRATAVRALGERFPKEFQDVLPTLRTDDAPLMQLTVALMTRRPEDVRGVPLGALKDAERRELWERCGAVLEEADRRRLLRELLDITASDGDAVAYTTALLSGSSAELAVSLLSHRLERVRLLAVAFLGKCGDVSTVSALRALEQSSLLARAQVKACRAAITAIQTRAGVGDAEGAVSLGPVDSRGAVSKPEDDDAH